MRLKAYSAPTHGEALALARRELGDEAVIVSSEGSVDGVRLTIAVQHDPNDVAAIFAADAETQGRFREQVEVALERHGAPRAVGARILPHLAGREGEECADVLADALAGAIGFAPCAFAPGSAWAFLGPTGVGKTASVAKTAAEAAIEGATVAAFEIAERKPAGDRLAALLAPLEVAPTTVPEAELGAAIERARAGGALALVDFGAVDPFDEDDLGAARALVADSGLTAIALLQAGLDPADSAEAADGWRALGARGLAITKVDAARRYGGVLAAATRGLPVCQFGWAPDIASPLAAATPKRLARLLLRQPRATGGAGET